MLWAAFNCDQTFVHLCICVYIFAESCSKGAAPTLSARAGMPDTHTYLSRLLQPKAASKHSKAPSTPLSSRGTAAAPAPCLPGPPPTLPFPLKLVMREVPKEDPRGTAKKAPSTQPGKFRANQPRVSSLAIPDAGRMQHRSGSLASKNSAGEQQQQQQHKSSSLPAKRSAGEQQQQHRSGCSLPGRQGAIIGGERQHAQTSPNSNSTAAGSAAASHKPQQASDEKRSRRSRASRRSSTDALLTHAQLLHCIEATRADFLGCVCGQESVGAHSEGAGNPESRHSTQLPDPAGNEADLPCLLRGERLSHIKADLLQLPAHEPSFLHTTLTPPQSSSTSHTSTTCFTASPSKQTLTPPHPSHTPHASKPPSFRASLSTTLQTVRQTTNTLPSHSFHSHNLFDQPPALSTILTPFNPSAQLLSYMRAKYTSTTLPPPPSPSAYAYAASATLNPPLPAPASPPPPRLVSPTHTIASAELPTPPHPHNSIPASTSRCLLHPLNNSTKELLHNHPSSHFIPKSHTQLPIPAGIQISWHSNSTTAKLCHAVHAARAAGAFMPLVPPLPPWLKPALTEPDSNAVTAVLTEPDSNAVTAGEGSTSPGAPSNSGEKKLYSWQCLCKVPFDLI